MVDLIRCSRCARHLNPEAFAPSCRKNGAWCRDCHKSYMAQYQKAKYETCLACGRLRNPNYRCVCQDLIALQRASRRCLQCDSMFVGKSSKKFCSTKCRESSHYTPVAKLQRECVWCYGEFVVSANRLTETCSRDCRVQLDLHYQRWSNRDRCFLPQCRRCGEWAGFDPTYAQWCRSCSIENNIAMRNANYALRKDVIRKGDKITISELMRRDNSVCHLCGKKTRWGQGPLGSMYPTIDHLVPISKGGEHTWQNVALACRRCNISRGNRGVAQLRLA